MSLTIDLNCFFFFIILSYIKLLYWFEKLYEKYEFFSVIIESIKAF